MRRWLFVFLIMLLPLRGWVGDAMAIQMALPGQHDPASGAMQYADRDAKHAVISLDASAAVGDCGGHTGVPDAGDASDSVHCEACAMCQTCHTVAVLQLPDLLAVAPASPVSPSAPMQVFASADRTLLLKPPIY